MNFEPKIFPPLPPRSPIASTIEVTSMQEVEHVVTEQELARVMTVRNPTENAATTFVGREGSIDSRARSSRRREGAREERSTTLRAVTANRHLTGVQYLRAFAAMSVATFHAGQRAGLELVGLASFGVPMFFVISGFIMVVITDASSRPLRFLIRRLIRIVPMYWLMTAAVLVVDPRSRHGAGKVAAALVFLPVKAGGRMLPPLDVGWTLNLEMMFYALFALALTAQPERRIWVLTVTIGSLALLGASAIPLPPQLAFWTQPTILLFLLGAWTGHVWKAGGLSPSLAAILISAFAASLAIVATAVPPALRANALVGSGVLPLMIVTLLLERRGLFDRTIPALHLLGDASYSIYLCHPIVLVLLPLWLTARLAPSAVLALGAIAGIGAGVVLYWLVERPLLHWGRALAGVPDR